MTTAPRKKATPVKEGRTKFNADDRRQLHGLGVTAEQIALLDNVLPLCAALIGDVAPMTDVRDALKDMHDKISSAHEALAGWDKPATKGRREARVRIQSAASDQDSLTELEQAIKALARVRDIIAIASEGLPKVGRRQKRATPFPVARIHEALALGWGQTHIPVRRGEQSAARQFVTPPYPFVPGIKKASVFYEVVALCYRAITGDRDYDPERAIKAFVRARKGRTEGPLNT